MNKDNLLNLNSKNLNSENLWFSGIFKKNCSLIIHNAAGNEPIQINF